MIFRTPRTDSVIDLLIIYAVNTGLLTGIFSVCSFIFVLTSPKNLIYSAFNIIAAKMYANSLLAVLNSRKFLQHKVQGDCFTSSSLRFPEERKTTGNSTTDTWNAPRLTHLSSSQGGGTVVGISLVPTGRGQTVSSGDVESIDTAARYLEAK
ncbi:hypothetical protein C2E23DRAFT_889121 [Lenzites betulinus]|nr:hypothetical protein C2E23DRAFT_889121 [Lenzites betulinus]